MKLADSRVDRMNGVTDFPVQRRSLPNWTLHNDRASLFSFPRHVDKSREIAAVVSMLEWTGLLYGENMNVMLREMSVISPTCHRFSATPSKA